MNKRRLATGFFGLIILIFALIFSNDSSTISLDFENNSPNEESAEEEFRIIGSEVLGETEPGNIGSVFDFSENETPENLTSDENSEESQEKGFKVIKVVDGDTIDVEIEGKVQRLRLIGINTPETVDPRKSVECFGSEASKKAGELLLGKFVVLENDDAQQDRDRYGRLLRYVFLPDGTHFNKYMISEGFAYEYTYGSPYKYQQEFKQAQLDAQNQNKGLWNSKTCPN